MSSAQTHYHPHEPYDRVSVWEDAAAEFELPDGWQEGRQPCSGLALDGPSTATRDDAFELRTLPSEEKQLSVHVADAASFLYDNPELRECAENRLFTRYRRERGRKASKIALWPARICDEVFSLTDQEEKPVLTVSMTLDGDPEALPRLSKGRLKADLMTKRRFRDRLRSSDSPETSMLETAKELFAARIDRISGEAYRDLELADCETHIEKDPAAFVVQEFMIHANAALARFVYANRLPAIFRTHQNIETMPSRMTEAGVVFGGLSRARFTLQQQPHERLGVPLYLRGTSPLLHLDSFVNTCNIVARLDRRSYVYPISSLHQFTRNMNRVSP